MCRSSSSGRPSLAAMVDDAHPERLGPLGDLGADPSQSDETERRARQVAAEQLGSRPPALPAALAHESVRLDEVAAAGEDQREREIGHRRVQHARRVRHCDSAIEARSDVHAVVADAVVRHQPQVGQEVELIRADRDNGLDEYLDAGKLLRRRPGLEQGQVRQLFPRRPREHLRRGDRHGRSISMSGRAACIVARVATVVIPFAGAEGKTRLHSSTRIRRALAHAMFCDVLAACVPVGRTRVVTPDEKGADAASRRRSRGRFRPRWRTGRGGAGRAWKASRSAALSWSTPTSRASCRTISARCSRRRPRAASLSWRRSTGRRTHSAFRRRTPLHRCTGRAAPTASAAHAASLGLEAVSVVVPNLADDVDTMEDLHGCNCAPARARRLVSRSSRGATSERRRSLGRGGRRAFRPRRRRTSSARPRRA